jgi:hypothetical protein
MSKKETKGHGEPLGKCRPSYYSGQGMSAACLGRGEGKWGSSLFLSCLSASDEVGAEQEEEEWHSER